MPNIVNVTGSRFGRLTALEPARRRHGRTMWRCRCDCGNEVVVQTASLRSGNTQSCGCLHTEQKRRLMKELSAVRGGNPRHGLCYSAEYHVWRMMKNRCLNPKVARYECYGGRGIEVCERWLKFENFYADMGARPEGRSPGGRALYSIERIDNDGDYEPGNCRWATVWDQAANKRLKRTSGLPKGVAAPSV